MRLFISSSEERAVEEAVARQNAARGGQSPFLRRLRLFAWRRLLRRKKGDSPLESAAGARRGTIASVALLCIAAASYGYIEYRARLLNADIAARESRADSDAEMQSLLDAKQQAQAGQRMFVLGNSLLLRGVQIEEVKKAFTPDIDVRRLVVVNTSYFDWLYATRKIFEEGGRPDVVVLVMSPRQFLASNVREDYFAHHLMRFQDAFSVASEMGLSNTAASSLAFANISQYYDLRARIRNQWLKKAIPNLGPMMDLITRQDNSLKDEFPETLAVERLRTLNKLSTQWKAKFVLVIPPSDGGRGDPAAAKLQTTGETAGVRVLLPIAAGSLAADRYLDGFHLNERGAQEFTARLIASLEEETVVRVAKKSPQMAAK